MNIFTAKRALKQTAKEYGVSLESLQKEIENAIAIGTVNPDPEVQAFWKSVPCTGSVPTPVELVAYLGKALS